MKQKCVVLGWTNHNMRISGLKKTNLSQYIWLGHHKSSFDNVGFDLSEVS